MPQTLYVPANHPRNLRICILESDQPFIFHTITLIIVTLHLYVCMYYVYMCVCVLP